MPDSSANIQRAAVVGAGVMGRGIALVCAQAGMDVQVFDLQQQVLDEAHSYASGFWQQSVAKGRMDEAFAAACLARFHTTTELSSLQAQLIIEAVPERLDLKHSVFRALEAVNAPDTIFASNTSTIPITQIAAALQLPARCVGLHFFNPAPLMKLVEVIAGAHSSPEVVETTLALARRLGKTPVLAQDQPGFIVNRVARHFYLESLRIAEEGIADPADIDRLMRSSGFRMGPFELMDLIGIDTNLAVSKSLYEAFFQEARFRPSRIQQQKVDAGMLGRKSGQGFYVYPPASGASEKRG